HRPQGFRHLPYGYYERPAYNSDAIMLQDVLQKQEEIDRLKLQQQFLAEEIIEPPVFLRDAPPLHQLQKRAVSTTTAVLIGGGAFLAGKLIGKKKGKKLYKLGRRRRSIRPIINLK